MSLNMLVGVFIKMTNESPMISIVGIKSSTTWNPLSMMFTLRFLRQKELWKTLENEYRTKDVGIERYTVKKSLKFNMEEGKSVINKVN